MQEEPSHALKMFSEKDVSTAIETALDRYFLSVKGATVSMATRLFIDQQLNLNAPFVSVLKKRMKTTQKQAIQMA